MKENRKRFEGGCYKKGFSIINFTPQFPFFLSAMKHSFIHIFSFLLTTVNLLHAVVTFPTTVSHNVELHQRATLPDDDPFYQPPDGFAEQDPGSILRNRTINAAFLGLLPAPVKAYQLLYRTTAINGSAIATVTTIFVPINAKKDKFVSFATAEDSAASKCAPSYTYQLGSAQDSLIVSVEFLLLQIYLASGYIVASPDYEGPDSAFGAGRLAGMGILDNMRAVKNFKDTLGLTTDNPAIVGAGYSGGALATGWATSLQPSYAKELTIKGWIQGGTPANLTGTAAFLDGTFTAGLLPPAFAGLSAPSAYGAQLTPLLDSIITEEGRKALEFAKKNCVANDILNFVGERILSTKFQNLGDRLLYEPTVAKVLRENNMGLKKEETPTAPVFIYHTTQDELIPYSNTTKLVDTWCNNGASVKFSTFANGGHGGGEILGIVDALTFVNDAFGDKIAEGCTQRTEYASTLNPIALGAELEPILLGLVNALLAFGQNDDENIKKDPSLLAKGLNT